MKGLLHSKKFRKNLYKWLCMYVGVLMLFTSVVTYSKYVSMISAKDKARVAKFEIEVLPDGCTVEADREKTCSIGEWNPLESKTFNIKVKGDFEVEVKMLLLYEINRKDGFKIVSITDDETDFEFLPSASEGQISISDLVNQYDDDGNYIDGEYNKTLKITIAYDPCLNKKGACDPADYGSIDENNIYKILSIGYLVSQN